MRSSSSACPLLASAMDCSSQLLVLLTPCNHLLPCLNNPRIAPMSCILSSKLSRPHPCPTWCASRTASSKLVVPSSRVVLGVGGLVWRASGSPYLLVIGCGGCLLARLLARLLPLLPPVPAGRCCSPSTPSSSSLPWLPPCVSLPVTLCRHRNAARRCSSPSIVAWGAVLLAAASHAAGSRACRASRAACM